MPSEYRLQRRVLFHETDMAGVVHFSCFFRYMEEAEHALWRAAGLSIAPQGSPIGWPRVAASCEFLQPLRFEDEFEVWLRVVAITNKTMRYACTLTKGDLQIAEGAMTVVCVSHRPDGTMTAIAIPPDVAACFEVHADAAE
jgi:YbgC/YbaW family acyl-CoA thioester hydrolase